MRRLLFLVLFLHSFSLPAAIMNPSFFYNQEGVESFFSVSPNLVNNRNDRFGTLLPVVIVSGAKRCAGSMIAEDKVLTAKHCLQSEGLDSLTVYSDQFFFSKSDLEEKYYARVVEVFDWCPESTGWCKDKISTSFSVPFPNPNPYEEGLEVAQHDFVVLSLDRPLGRETGTFRFPTLEEGKSFSEKWFQLAGYPEAFGESSYFPFKYISEPVCSILDSAVTSNVTYSNCSSLNGLSGGPLFFLDDLGDPVLIGVISARIPIFKRHKGGVRTFSAYKSDFVKAHAKPVSTIEY